MKTAWWGTSKTRKYTKKHPFLIEFEQKNPKSLKVHFGPISWGGRLQLATVADSITKI